MKQGQPAPRFQGLHRATCGRRATRFLLDDAGPWYRAVHRQGGFQPNARRVQPAARRRLRAVIDVERIDDMLRVPGAVAVIAVVGLATSACFHAAPGPTRISRATTTQTAGIGVNSYLWRATLDTLAFMPLASADPYGGTVITDWYNDPAKPGERFKATVYILDTRLRADGLNVTVFKQIKDASGQWVDAPVSDQTDIDIENSILTPARQLRLSNLSDRG